MDFIAIAIIALYSIDIALLFFFGMHSYIMVYLYRKNEKYCVSTADSVREAIDINKTPADQIPIVTVQLPVFNEFYVVDRLIEATTQMVWPRSRLEIQVLDDSTDESKEKAATLVEMYRSQGFDIHHLHRTDRTGHKAGALKEGLKVAKGNYVAIFDADFMPASDFLIKTVPYFDEPKIGMVQTRWGHINDDYSVLTKAQSFGIDGPFMIEQVARNCNNLWMNFNGTGGIWRKQCIIDAGNWQSDTLTEDFDLSYRAELAGWHFRYFKDIVNPAELPATMSAFKSQQFRWCKGSIQTAVKLIPTILKSKFSWRIKSEAIVHLLNYSVHPLMVINILFCLPLLLMDTWTGYSIYDVSLAVLFGAATLMSLGTFGPVTFYIYSQRELYPDWKTRIVWMPVLMMIGTGIAIVCGRAWLEAILGIQSTFKRTPKYRIEKKGDKLEERMKYKLPLDKTVFIEFFMGFYCLACIYFSILREKPFVVPFMLIYAAGFFYVAISSLSETFVRSGSSKTKPLDAPARV
ncbi:MAG: glycosyltransferase family 2 protein [Spirochaetia bacterium]|nr:glycosyltransferase family 2 protein [Spirochaetia bacterium]